MNYNYSFESHPVYQEAMAFAYACLKRTHAFPPGYQAYGDELKTLSFHICKKVAQALSHQDFPDFDAVKQELVACVPIIDLAMTAGIIRENDRSDLRERLAKLVLLLEEKSIAYAITTKEGS